METRTSAGGKLKFTMGGGAELRKFGMERLKVSHAFLDVAYSKNIEDPIRLFKDMENAGNHNVRSHLYREVNKRISGRNEGDVLAEQGGAWPAAFLKTRTSENPQQTLAKVEDACAFLENKYLLLIEAGSILRAARNHSDVDMKDDIQAVFETISSEIWDGKDPNGSEKPQRPPKTTSKITTFLAQSYDAVSLALGAIGLHLSILKNETLPTRDSNDQGDLINSINNANQAYKGVRELMDGIFLSISHDQLMRHSTIASPGVSRRMELKFTNRFRAGTKLNPFEALAKKMSVIPGLDWLNLGKGVMVLEVNNGVGTALLDVSVKYTHSRHPNLGRCGHFIDLIVKGGIQLPFLKEALEKMPAFLEKTMKKAKLNTIDAGEENTVDVDKNLSMMIMKKLGAALKTLAKETYMEGGLIGGVQLRFRAYPNTLGSSNTLGFELQFTRFIKEDLLTVNGTVMAHSGGINKLGGEVNIQTGQRIATTQLEGIGGDLGYNMLQFPRLNDILTSASTNEKRKKLLDENPLVKSQFFSTKAIFKIVKSHAEFLKSIEEGAVKKHYGFYMYHDEKYKEFLESAAQQAFYAGTGTVDSKNAPESIYARMTKNYVSATDVSRAEAELEIKQNYRKNLRLFNETGGQTGGSKKPSAVDTTVDYFLNEPKGRKILDAYCKIVRTYREANVSLMVNEGYQLKLRESGTVRKSGTLRPVRETPVFEAVGRKNLSEASEKVMQSQLARIGKNNPNRPA